jgi:hypothetical protein
MTRRNAAIDTAPSSAKYSITTREYLYSSNR